MGQETPSISPSHLKHPQNQALTWGKVSPRPRVVHGGEDHEAKEAKDVRGVKPLRKHLAFSGWACRSLERRQDYYSGLPEDCAPSIKTREPCASPPLPSLLSKPSTRTHLVHLAPDWFAGHEHDEDEEEKGDGPGQIVDLPDGAPILELHPEPGGGWLVYMER